MDGEPKQDTALRPASAAAVAAQARQAFENLLCFCRQDGSTFRRFEASLLAQVFALGCLLVRLFLTARHERLDVGPYAPRNGWRRGDPDAARTLKTVFGPVPYRRAQVMPKRGGAGF